MLTEDEHPEGYLLLRCLRAYLEHDMYFGLEQHTEHTLHAGRAWLLKFSNLISVRNPFTMVKLYLTMLPDMYSRISEI